MLARPTQKLSVEAYLQAEMVADVKHELIDGQVYARAGVSANHERIRGNLLRKLGNHLENKPCEPFGLDMKVKVGTDFFYPDALVDCQFDDSTPYFSDSPIIIVEVLSKATRKADKIIKKLKYFNLPSLQEYLLIEQDYCEIEVFRRNPNWRSVVYTLGDTLKLESIDLTFTVQELYHRVNNEDMLDFLQRFNQNLE
jgi:Uma2 family endonuclease